MQTSHTFNVKNAYFDVGFTKLVETNVLNMSLARVKHLTLALGN
jgi:hypothetical protein